MALGDDLTLTPGFTGNQTTMIRSTRISRTAEGAIKAGQPVMRGSADADGGALLANSNTSFLGVAINTVDTGQPVGIVTKGDTWVETSEPVSAGDPVYFAAADGTWNKTSGNQVSNATFEFNSIGDQNFVDLVDVVGNDAFTAPAVTAINKDGKSGISFTPTATDFLHDFTSEDVQVIFTVDGDEFVVDLSGEDFDSEDAGAVATFLDSTALANIADIVDDNGDVIITSKTPLTLKTVIRLQGAK